MDVLYYLFCGMLFNIKNIKMFILKGYDMSCFINVGQDQSWNDLCCWEHHREPSSHSPAYGSGCTHLVQLLLYVVAKGILKQYFYLLCFSRRLNGVQALSWLLVCFHVSSSQMFYIINIFLCYEYKDINKLKLLQYLKLSSTVFNGVEMSLA